MQPVSSNADPLDKVCADAVKKRANWTMLFIGMPGFAEKEGDDLNSYSAYLNFNDHSGLDEADDYSYNKLTGQLVTQSKQEGKTLGEKWRNSNYAIHTGGIYGLPTKILASAATLFCAFLPVTGFLIWWGRRKKSRPVTMIKRRKHFLQA